MKSLLSLTFLFAGANAFAFDFDLNKKRECIVNQTTTAVELYHPSEIKKGQIAKTQKSGDKLALQELINDHFVYFTDKVDTPIFFDSEYIWRYSGQSQKSIDGLDHTIYSSGSLAGSLLIIFQKTGIGMDIVYLKINGNKTLVSLSCED